MLSLLEINDTLTMTEKERTILLECVQAIRNSDDEIEPLVRLYNEVKKLLKFK